MSMRNVTVGIDIGSHIIRVMVVEHVRDNGRSTSRIIGTGTAESR
jgi:cell division ATPase FtsA